MKGKGIEGKTLRFNFTDGPMKGKEYDHIFSGEKVKWGPAGSDKKTESKGALAEVGTDYYVGSYMGDKGYTLTRAMNLNTMNFKTGELVAFASDGKQWSQHTGTVEVVA